MSTPQYNPRDRIKNHLKRKSSSRFNETVQSSSQSINFAGLDSESCPVPSGSNPFKISSPQKKRRPPQVHFEESEENALDSFSFGPLKQQNELKTPTKTPEPKKSKGLERFRSFDPTLLQQFHAVDFSHMMEKPGEKREEKLEESQELPLDLRIGTKVRIVSKSAFPWMKTRKSTGIVGVRIPAADRYEGMKFFNQIYASGAENPSIPPPQSSLSVLESATLFYQFPVIPGMSLYPRITAELSSNMSRVPLAPISTDSMANQWVECTEQLFMSYKKGERDSFFVAAAVFNVLFTKTQSSDEVDCLDESQSCFPAFGGQKLVALVSNTSSCTREHLRSQGVDYEVIGAKTMRRTSSSTALSAFSSATNTCDGLESNQAPVSEKDPNEEGSEDQKEAEESENDSPTKANHQWLQDIGVSPRHIRSSSSRRKLSAMVDRDGISCLLVKGSAVQSLYNTLMSSEIVHEKTGPYTKIPPTLIATAPFLYGQLLSLNKSSQVISKASTKTTEYVLELDGGPILPHCTKMMTRFLRTSQLCAENAVTMTVSDRHSNNGMNDWTDVAKSWNTVKISQDCVRWASIAN